MKIIILAAVASNGVIGVNNALPWSYPEDLKKFKEITSGEGKVLFMGRKTYSSLPITKSGERLPGRKLLVLTKTFRYAERNALFVTDINQGLDFLGDVIGAKEVYIVGGASLYRYFLQNKLATHMIITRVNKPYKGDVYFPKYNQSDWRELSSEPLNKDCDLIHYEWKM